MPRKKKEEIIEQTNEVDEVEAAIEAVEKGTKPKQELPKLDALAIGQAYFCAPDGYVIIGDDTKNDIWYRAGNNGKGMFINKMHESEVIARGGTVFHKK